MVDVASLALKVDSTQVVTADKNLDSFNKSAAKTDTAVGKTNTGFKAMKGSTQNLSFQLQDIAVQAQAGTNAFTILGQQGPQIASIFGPGGAVVGVLVAVSALVGGVLYNSFLKGGEGIAEFAQDVRDAKEDVIGFTETLRALTIFEFQRKVLDAADAIAKTKKELDRIKSSPDPYGNLIEDTSLLEATLVDQETQLLILNRQFKDIAKSTADYSNDQDELDKQSKKLTSSLLKLESQQERDRKRIEGVIDRYQALSDTVGLTRAETIRYTAAVQAENVASEEQRQRLLDAAEAYALNVERQEELTEAQKDARKEVKELEREQNKLTDSISNGLTDAIQGYKTFGDVVLSVLDDIAAALIQKNITDPLVDIFSGAATGGGSDSSGGGSGFLGDLLGGLFSPNAKGGVINEAGIVGTQNGKMAVAGEAGPEAILPLTRGSGGDLGVKATGLGGSSVVVNVINESGAEANVSESQGANGERIVNVTVLKAVRNAFSTGALDRDLKTNFGIARQGT